MRKKYPFIICDVFGEKRYTGNQLAVFLDAGNISSEEMLQIAKEIHFSETTFIESSDKMNGGYNVRIFTPTSEIDFAGHPTLGTAYTIWKYFLKSSASKVVLNLKAGQVPVTFEQKDAIEIGWMHQPAPQFDKTLRSNNVSKILGIPDNEIDADFPIQIVSTGLPHLIVPLKRLTALKKIKIDINLYNQFISEFGQLIILAFCPEPYIKLHELSVRVFPLCYDIPEDPATGSGNGCLAAYLIRHQYFGKNSIDIQVGQGYEMGRPSTLHLKSYDDNDQIEVYVGGKVVLIAEGEWF